MAVVAEEEEVGAGVDEVASRLRSSGEVDEEDVGGADGHDGAVR